MDSEPEDRISRLKSRLSKAREQARVQQNTLDHILRLLQGLQVPGTLQVPQDTPPAPPAPQSLLWQPLPPRNHCAD